MAFPSQLRKPEALRPGDMLVVVRKSTHLAASLRTKD